MINFHLLYKAAQAERMLKEAGPAPGPAQRAAGPVKNPAAVPAPRMSTLDVLARQNARPTAAGPPPGWVPPSMRNIGPVPVPRSPQGGPAPKRVYIPPVRQVPGSVTGPGRKFAALITKETEAQNRYLRDPASLVEGTQQAEEAWRAAAERAQREYYRKLWAEDKKLDPTRPRWYHGTPQTGLYPVPRSERAYLDRTFPSGGGWTGEGIHGTHEFVLRTTPDELPYALGVIERYSKHHGVRVAPTTPRAISDGAEQTALSLLKWCPRGFIMPSPLNTGAVWSGPGDRDMDSFYKEDDGKKIERWDGTAYDYGTRRRRADQADDDNFYNIGTPTRYSDNVSLGGKQWEPVRGNVKPPAAKR